MVTKYLRSANALFEEIDDEAVILNIGDGCYYGLNNTGRTLWQMLNEPLTAEELSIRLALQYSESEPTSAVQDVLEFLENLQQCQLVEAHSSEI